MDDRRVEAGFDALVEEDRVEDLPGGRIEAERDVRQPEQRVDAGQLGLDPPDALDRLDPVLPALLHAGRQREGERVEEQVARLEAVAVDRDVVDRPGGSQLPVGCAGLPLLVDARADDGRAELAGQSEERVEPGAVAVAFFEVDGVEHRPAADPRQRGPDDWALGRVDHQRHARLRGEPAGDLGHVGDAVRAGVVDADVDEVRALLDLFAGHRHTAVPVAGEHRLAELLRPVGVRPLADDEERRVLVERDSGVDGRGRRLRLRVPGGGGHPGAALDHRGQVRRGRPAAAADGGDAELGDEPVEVVGELVRRQVVVHPAVDDRRQAGVRQAGDRDPAVGGEVAERLAHLGRAGRAVEPDDVDLHRVERGQRGRDLGARQHPAGQLDRHLHLQRHLAADLGHRLLAGVDDGLGRQQVEDGSTSRRSTPPSSSAIACSR